MWMVFLMGFPFSKKKVKKSKDPFAGKKKRDQRKRDKKISKIRG
jgi:hypothetical protein